MNVKQNQLHIDNHITMIATYPTPEPHQHIALHLFLAAHGMLQCLVNGEKISARAIMIASDVLHTVDVTNGETVVFLFDTISTQAQNMQRLYLQQQPYYILPSEMAEELQNLYASSNGDLEAFDKKACSFLGLWNRPGRLMDPRIQDVLLELSTMTELPEDAFAYACQRACLSKSRFSHLFKENTGMSFRRYFVLLKLQVAYNAYQSGKSITEISMDSGFDSPSHFANTMHRMFGISASDFRKSM